MGKPPIFSRARMHTYDRAVPIKKAKKFVFAAHRNRSTNPTQADVTVGDMRKALGKIRRDPRFQQGEYIGLEFIIRTHTVEIEATSMRYGKRAQPLRVAAFVSNRAQIKEAVALFWKSDAQAHKKLAAREAMESIRYRRTQPG